MIDPVIDRDVACVQCGYNLRGLPAAGLCPECAHGIAESLVAPDLTSQGRRWLGRIRAGLWMQIYSRGFGVFYMVPYLGYYLRLRQFTPAYRLLLRKPVHLPIIIAWNIVALASIWLMTTPNPTGEYIAPQSTEADENSSSLTIRQLLRYFACFSFLGTLASLFGSPRLGASPTSALWLRYWLWQVIDFASIYLCYLFIEKRLGVLVRLRGVVRQAGILKYVKPSVDVGLATAFVIAYGGGWIGPRQDLQLLSIRAVLTIAVNLWAIGVLFALVQPFRRALQTARV
jgi:hypothetical protein